MKRILFVVPFLSGGGAERVVSIWASELSKLGEDVHLLVFYRIQNEYSIDDKVVIHAIKGNKDEYDALTKTKRLFLIRRALRDIKPGVVLPFISYVGLIITIVRIGLPVKVIETIRINPRYSPSKKVGRWVRNVSVFFSNGCIVQSTEQLKYFPRYMQERMIVLPNPIADEFTKEAKLFAEKKIKILVAVGRLEKQKNYPMLMHAFSKVAKNNKDLTLNIYGEGSLYKELTALIYELDIDGRVKLCGRTSNIVGALNESDLFVLSSEAEGMPNSLMEAMALGLPCISTDCPTGPSDLIQNDINGILIPVGDEKALIEAIYRMINNVDDAIEMGKNARTEILSKYSADSSGLELMEFISSI